MTQIAAIQESTQQRLSTWHQWLMIGASIAVLAILSVATTASAQDSAIDATVTAANAFLDSLTEEQRTAVMFDFEDETQRENWSNFPTGLFERAGISYGEMTDAQRELALTLMQAALSDEGYQKLYDAMIGDEILLQTSGSSQLVFGIAEYYISFLGEPSATDAWILQWGGHHFALNVTFAGTEESLAPSHTGCQPCTYIIDDREVSVLGDEYMLARELVNSLDADLQEQAILDYSVTNLVAGPGEANVVLEPEGVSAAEMTAEQQELLLSVVAEWVNIADETAAAARMEQLAAEVSEMYFAWSGGISDTDFSSYFRITGPTLLIEYAPQGNGGGGGAAPAGGAAPGGDSGEAATASGYQLELGEYTIIETDALYHVHTIYRDPTNPYGLAYTGE